MASRADKKRRYRTQQQHTTLRAGEQPGVYEISVALGSLEPPENEYYANTARMVRRPNHVEFIFGQFTAGGGMVERAVGIDVPYRTIRPLRSTFDSPGFRERLTESARGAADMEVFQPVLKGFQSVNFGAHLARIVLNDFGAVIDFYELLPAVGTSQPVGPVLRVKSLPAVLHWFVSSVEELVKDLEVVPSNPETKTP